MAYPCTLSSELIVAGARELEVGRGALDAVSARAWFARGWVTRRSTAARADFKKSADPRVGLASPRYPSCLGLQSARLSACNESLRTSRAGPREYADFKLRTAPESRAAFCLRRKLQFSPSSWRPRPSEPEEEPVLLRPTRSTAAVLRAAGRAAGAGNEVEQHGEA